MRINMDKSKQEADKQDESKCAVDGTTIRQAATGDTKDHQAESEERSTSTALRRQPTKYPHGLCISVQTVRDDHPQTQHYSRAPTLPRAWECQAEETCLRKYKISMISNPESLAELQVRRYKYPLTGNYYLDTQEAGKSPFMLLEHAKHYCRWKYLRWPIIFVASVLLFFGLITYCIWLHDVSVAREKYLQRRYQLSAATEDNEIVLRVSSSTVKVQQTNTTTTTTTTSTERGHPLQESTILRAIGTRMSQRPKVQKLSTMDYTASKQPASWDKKKKVANKVEATATTSLTDQQQPTAEPEHSVHFTSGHQNSFGVPIEADERVLRLLNRPVPAKQDETATVNILAKVSPTIPPVAQANPNATLAATRTTAQESGCYSTSLPMCQGVMEYDLTYNSTFTLDSVEQEAYQKLVSSNCSERALEFICAALEPECRPLHIGVLPPCRRICKAILEACSIVIASSDILTATFDCSLYPDSNDPLKCEDPTRRRDYCYDNEYACHDRSCVPDQWHCDNIKDCASGEDEDNCLVCSHQDEFRCRSNDKCVPDSVRCDLKYDCFDGSDEDDCDEFGSGEQSQYDESTIDALPRVFSYASFLSPNQSNSSLFTYITTTSDDESGTKFQAHELTNRTSGVSHEEVTNSVPGDGPKGFVNFRDSKEIMMTSDSENKFKYSAARTNRTSSKYSSSTTPATTEAPSAPITCEPHQLRCVSGKCITVAQLCDKKIDCPDGADELMCVYKERTTTVRSNRTSINTRRPEKRTIRTTIRRKVKT